MLTRRSLLKVLAASQVALPSALALAAPKSRLSFGPPEKFDFEALKERARGLAKTPYVPPPSPDPKVLAALDYDALRNVKYNLSDALYGNGAGPYPVTFLTSGSLFLKSVKMFAVEGGTAREILFKADYFDLPPGSPLEKLSSEPSPFAGFEVKQSYDKVDLREHEGWARFVGASYFRAVGEADQFGLSARGIAQNPGGGPPEEFPDFTHFWIEEGKSKADPVLVHALLDGPSVVGAYRFSMHRGRATVMDISCQLHLRKPITRLGIAPLTSMYWYSETAKGTAVDWRPEVHDSDGVAIWTGKGERLWRPLNNQPQIHITSFDDENPRGWGLMQRDKDFDHYLDEVRYESRPCGWVEPVGEWGKGAVQLVEIPTDNEIYDNVILMWKPAAPNAAGDVLDYRYKLHWTDNDPYPGDLGRCVATREGRGGVTGAVRSQTLRTFMLDFQGPALARLDEGQIPKVVVQASHGDFQSVEARPSPDGKTDLFRVRFDLDPKGADFVDVTCHLEFGGKPVSETWTFRYYRFSSPDR